MMEIEAISGLSASRKVERLHQLQDESSQKRFKQEVDADQTVQPIVVSDGVVNLKSMAQAEIHIINEFAAALSPRNATGELTHDNTLQQSGFTHNAQISSSVEAHDFVNEAQLLAREAAQAKTPEPEQTKKKEDELREIPNSIAIEGFL